MARGKTLLKLLQDLRAEIRASGNAAHNASAREGQVVLLNRIQEDLYDKYDWPLLRIERTLDVQAGQRYYDTPDDINIDRLESIQVRYGQQWCELGYGIDASHYSTWDSDLDERSWPVDRWMIYEGEQIELWPVPSDNVNATSLDGRLKLIGIKKLTPMVQDDDVAMLDDRLIVLHAAAETLGASGAKDAAIKLNKAQERERMLTSNMSKIKTFSLSGNSDDGGWKPKGPPRVAYRVTGGT
jgi:hypothetical protein